MDGYTLMHEHTTIDLSGVKADTDCKLDCKEETIKEYRQLYLLGVRTIVDVTAEGMGRNTAYVKQVEKETGIKIIHSTGFYKEPFLPSRVYEMNVSQIADFMIREILEGIDGKVKAGMIGEIGTSKNEMKPAEKKVFDAAVIAARETKRPIYTHTTLGTYALEQAKFFEKEGTDMSRVVIGHVALSGNLEYIREVLKTGAVVGFDTIGKNVYLEDKKRIEFIRELEQAGLLNQVVLSLDLTRKSHLQYKGGIGYIYLFEKFLPELRSAGVSENSINQMLVENPKRILGGI